MASTLDKAADQTAQSAASLAASKAALRRYGAALVTLKKRGEFQRLRGGVRWSGAAFLLEGKPRLEPAAGRVPVTGIRLGFTITKKIGKAHERNRMRRRLSHALRSIAVPPALETWDCVIVARRPAHDCPFDDLVRDFEAALKRLARAPAPATQPAPHGRDSVTSKPPARGA